VVPPVFGPKVSSIRLPDLSTTMTSSDEVKVITSKLTVPEIVTVVLSTVLTSSKSVPSRVA
jgi:hypothetical protein